MVTKSGIIDGDLSSGKSVMHKQVISVRHKTSFTYREFLAYLCEFHDCDFSKKDLKICALCKFWTILFH